MPECYTVAAPDVWPGSFMSACSGTVLPLSFTEEIQTPEGVSVAENENVKGLRKHSGKRHRYPVQPWPAQKSAFPRSVQYFDGFLAPWVKLVKTQNKKNQTRAQGPTRTQWSAGDKPPALPMSPAQKWFFHFYSKSRGSSGTGEAKNAIITEQMNK